LRLGFVGSLMVSKAPHLLLEAIGRLPRGSVSVDLYGGHAAYHGDDSYRAQLEPLLGQAGVQLHGAIAHEQVGQALSSIDVLVVPSIWPENSPLVIQEAFLAGVPVVASRIGGIPEIVADGANGLLFPAGDAEGLSGSIARLLREPGLLDTLRAGIPPVRSMEDDVRFARSLYERHRTQRTQSTQSQGFGARSVLDVRESQRLAAVVLNFRTPDETLLAVKSLLASRRPIDDLIVVDNSGHVDGAGNDVRDALKGVWPRMSCIDTGSNLGFSGGMNAGIREALDRGAGRVLLVNSDVIVPPDAVERLEQSLDAAPHAGIAGPVVLSRSAPDTIASLGMSYRPSTGRMRHRGAGLAGSRADRARMEAGGAVDGVSGCAMLVRREVFEAVGFLDEEYFFGFEDLDFCLEARRAGFATILADRATIYHEGGQSLGSVSPRRFYFAARNHLLLARRADPASGRLRRWPRACSIVMLNLAHAAVSRGGSLPARLGAVVKGTRDYAAGRFGSGQQGHAQSRAG
jgi:GT2 family glycosyltransferase